MKSYSLNDLENMLDFFELKNRPLLLHSSLFSIGKLKNTSFENTPKKLLEFFCELENFNQPAFNYTFPKTKYIDLTLPNSEVGILSNEMIKKGFFRTIHPIFSFVGNNKNFIKPDFVDHNPFGKNSFFDRLTQNNGVVIVLGANPFVATYIIYAEFMAKVQYRFLKPFFGEVKTKEKIIKDSFYHFAFPLNESYKHNYCEFHKYLLDKKIAKEFKIGSSKAYGFDTQKFSEELKNYIKENPFRLLDSKPKYFYIFDKEEKIIKEIE